MVNEKVKWLWNLTRAQRMLFFSELSHGMTIAMRVICRSTDAGVLERIDELNEAHHAVSGYLLRICSGTESENWLTLSINGMFKSKDSILRQQLDCSWLNAENILRDDL
jgi:hypothetical protein